MIMLNICLMSQQPKDIPDLNLMSSEKETNPYTPPQSVFKVVSPARANATKLAKAGAWLQLLPVVGIIGTVLGMTHAFSTLSTDGVGDPSKLSAAIGEVLISTALGFWGGMIGFVCLGVAVFIQGNQPRWVKVLFWIAALPALYAAFMFVMMVLSAPSGGVE
jgi:hypothetical protein